MLSKLLHLLGRSFGILMGWRRRYRPGDLTSRIFIEHDRAISRLTAISPVKQTEPTLNLLSVKSKRPQLRATRAVIQAKRISLIANRSIARVAQTNSAPGKRESHRVVWLDISGKSGPTVASAHMPTKLVDRSNVVVFQTRMPLAKFRKSEAA